MPPGPHTEPEAVVSPAQLGLSHCPCRSPASRPVPHSCDMLLHVGTLGGKETQQTQAKDGIPIYKHLSLVLKETDFQTK